MPQKGSILWNGPCIDCGSTDARYTKGLCQPCYKRTWVAANRDRLVARAHSDYLANRDRRYEATRAWVQTHPEARRAIQNRYAANNRAKVLQASERSRKANPIPSRESAQRRRARKLENIELGVLFERDGGFCQICQKPVDLKLQWPSKLMATLDHIVPLAAGGEHSYRNTRLAHRVCNNTRGHRGPAQIPLFA